MTFFGHESQAARIRRLVASGSTPEQAAHAVGVPLSRALGALGRRDPGRPLSGREMLRVRVASELAQKAREADPDRLRSAIERVIRGL